MGGEMSVPADILRCARELRVTQTDAENLLWQILRNRLFCGIKFRRQHPVGRYILDFFSQEAMLAIELDGGGHAAENKRLYDAQRSKELEGAGIRILRFWNDEVLRNTEAVLEAIYEAIVHTPAGLHRESQKPPHPAFGHPLPEGEGIKEFEG